ncbi:MAG: NADH-quinone oxidoreductase subunit M [Bacteroidales bacterium]|nr:NADH-quinone oxidoreductase subunit M [Bacteroidales bacterium]
MIVLVILLIPFITGLLLLLIRNAATIKLMALASAIVNLAATLSLAFSTQASSSYSVSWINFLDINFALGYDGTSLIMLSLTSLLFPFIIMAGMKREQEHPGLLYALILFTQSALIGVFLAQNAFLFYIFWELTLIPLYFILLLWGGEGRRNITFKFFIYTLTGSLFLLFGIIYLYSLTPGLHTTDFSVFSQLNIPANTQVWLFWVLFIAFAIKMPVFPFHTWQPSTYTMAPTQGVMILAGVMTKMGIYGALRFLFPIIPAGVLYWQNTVIILSLIGVIYASVIAFRQTNLKTLIAFSSMAHISLMVAAMFVLNYYALQGLLFQVLSHGITIVALFYVVMLIEEKTGTLELPKMGGIKLLAPYMAILFLLIVLGSVALPLTAGFVGEFLIITGLFQQSIWFALFGGFTMVLGAIYMLYAYQRVMLGEKRPDLENITDLKRIDYIVLIPLITLILVLGIYPQPVFNLVETSVNTMQNLLVPVADVLPSLPL